MQKWTDKEIIESYQKMKNIFRISGKNPLFNNIIENTLKDIIHNFRDGNLLNNNFSNNLQNIYSDSKDEDNNDIKNLEEIKLLICKIGILENLLKNIIYILKDNSKDDFLTNEFKDYVKKTSHLCSIINIDFDLFLGTIFTYSLKNTNNTDRSIYLLENHINPDQHLYVKENLSIGENNISLSSPVYLAALYQNQTILDILINNTNFSQFEIISEKNTIKDDRNNIFILPSVEMKSIDINDNNQPELYRLIENTEFSNPIIKKSNFYQKGLSLLEIECIKPIKDLCLLLSFDISFSKEYLSKKSKNHSIENTDALKKLYLKNNFINEEKESIILSSCLLSMSESKLFINWNWRANNNFALKVLFDKKDNNIFNSNYIDLISNIKTDIIYFLKSEYQNNPSSYNKNIKSLFSNHLDFIKNSLIASKLVNSKERYDVFFKQINFMISESFSIINYIKDQSLTEWKNEKTDSIIKNMFESVNQYCKDNLDTEKNIKNDTLLNIISLFEKNCLSLSFIEEKNVSTFKKRI